MWLLILGVAGLFLRYLAGHSAYRRYLCDSSYFLYIAHMPVILAFQLLLKDVALPPLAKIAIALVGTIAILMPIYRYAVRPTFIGAVLNGRRYSSTIRSRAKTRSSSGGSTAVPKTLFIDSTPDIDRGLETGARRQGHPDRRQHGAGRREPTCRPGSRATTP